MLKRIAPIFMSVVSVALLFAAKPISADDDSQKIKVILRLEGGPAVHQVKGKVYSFLPEHQEDWPIELSNGTMTATISLPAYMQDPINVEAAAVLTFGDSHTCNFSAEQNVLVTPGQNLLVMRGVCI